MQHDWRKKCLEFLIRNKYNEYFIENMELEIEKMKMKMAEEKSEYDEKI